MGAWGNSYGSSRPHLGSPCAEPAEHSGTHRHRYGGAVPRRAQRGQRVANRKRRNPLNRMRKSGEPCRDVWSPPKRRPHDAHARTGTRLPTDEAADALGTTEAARARSPVAQESMGASQRAPALRTDPRVYRNRYVVASQIMRRFSTVLRSDRTAS